MRILHLADIHIGVENYGHPATEADIAALPPYFAPEVDRTDYLGLSTRLLDFLSTLDEAVDFALSHDIDLVLFAGDAYKSRDPSQTHQREFARRIARLANTGVPVFLLVGNHDLPHVVGRASALEIFHTLDVRNVSVAERLDTYAVQTRQGPLQVVGLPWIRRSAFLAREETRNLTLEQITEQLEQRLTRLLQGRIGSLDPSIPAILCAHVTVSTAKLSSERSMMLGNDHQLLLGTVANSAFDYVALGHIHRHQTLSQNPLTVYAGSLQRVDFSEEDDQKGFCVIELDPSQVPGQRLVSFDFHPVQARPFLTIDVTVHPGQDPTEAVQQAIARRHVAGAVVRVRVTMPGEVEPLFREQEVRAALKGAYHIAAIDRDVRRERRTRLPEEEVERLSPREALRKYLETREMAPDRAALLLRYGDQLIQEALEEESDG